ncbi:MAG: translation initiation factor [Chitinophagales bacterium]|nr:translation initiation factor [Chitinophagales bacterium]MDW8417872.1 translation initiation factor [Chitinophagales bacterium]
MKDWKDKLVYSTNPDVKPEEEEREETQTLPPARQTLYLTLQRLKGGKLATVVENFIGNSEDLAMLGKTLKNKCGVGGTVKDGIIHLQGDHRNKLKQILLQMGYQVKLKGG